MVIKLLLNFRIILEIEEVVVGGENIVDLDLIEEGEILILNLVPLEILIIESLLNVFLLIVDGEI